MIKEAPWQCAPLSHDCLLQLITGVELPTVVDSLLQGPQMAYRPDLNQGCSGRFRLNTGYILTPLVRDDVSRNVRWRTILVQSPLVAPSSVLRFH